MPKAIRWKNIPSFSRYQVSSDGKQIRRSCVVTSAPNEHAPGALMKVMKKRSGYLCVKLTRDDGYSRDWGVHFIVALAFCGPRPSLRHEAAHWDDVKGNNHPTNIRWATRKQNAADGVRNGRHKNSGHYPVERRVRGETCPRSKLTDVEVLCIRALVKERKNYRAVAVQFGITPENVGYIVRRATWTHLP